MVHVRKCWPDAFEAIKSGGQRADFRKEDRPDERFHIGDCLALWEYLPGTHVFTQRMVEQRITHVQRGPHYGIPVGYAMLSLGAWTG